MHIKIRIRILCSLVPGNRRTNQIKMKTLIFVLWAKDMKDSLDLFYGFDACMCASVH